VRWTCSTNGREVHAVHLLYEPVYVIPRVGNLTGKSPVCFNFPPAYEDRKYVEV
jgi:hypothetical protein